MANGIFGRGSGGGFFTPERREGLAAIGLGLSQLGAGQQVNLSQPLAALQKRQQDAKTREQLEGLSGRFTPDQQAILATMSPAQAAQIIAQDAFRAPAAPTKGIVINGQLVNPVTGQPMGDFRDPAAQPDTGFIVSGQAALEQYGLDPAGSYNITTGPEGVKASRIGGAGTNVTVNLPGPTSPAGKKFDEALGTELAEFQLTGAADASKNLAQLKAARDNIASGAAGNVSGPLIGPLSGIPGVGPIFAPGAINTQEQIAEVVQRNLKEILGAQFTAKEGEQLIARAFNPSLDEATNLARIDRLIRQMELAFEQKSSAAAYFAQNGTLNGWQGKIPTINDFDILSEDAPAPGERLKFNTATGEFE